jgi:YVTN family beta-propeller protein
VHLTQVGGAPFTGAVDPATHTAYIANYNSGTVSVINDATCSALVLSACGGMWPTVAVGNGPGDVAVDQATDTIYVANTSDDTVSVIDGTTCNAEVSSGCGLMPPTMAVGPGPNSLAFDPATKTLYVTDNGPDDNGAGHAVSVIDAATCNATDHTGCGQTPPKIRVGSGPFDLDLNVANDTIYVTNQASNTVSVINGAICDASVVSGCNQHPPTVAVATGPGSEIAFDPASDSVYVANTVSNVVSVFSGANCNGSVHSGCGHIPTTVQLVGLGHGIPDDVAVDDASHTLYAVIAPCPCADTNFSDNEGQEVVAMVNTRSCNGTITSGCGDMPRTAPAGGFPLSVLVDSQQDTVYMGMAGGRLAVLGTRGCNATHTEGCPRILPNVTVGIHAFGMGVDQRTHTLYVENTTENTVSVVNTALCNAAITSGCQTIAPKVAVGQQPQYVAVDEATDSVYVTNYADGTVSVIDGHACNASLHSGCSRTPPVVKVGVGAEGVAVDEATDTIYVTVDGAIGLGDTVRVIDGAVCNATVTSGCNQTPRKITLGGSEGGASPDEPAVDDATDTVYVPITGSDGLGNTVSVINGATCNATVTSGCDQIPKNITVGSGAFAAAVDESTGTVYETNFNDDTVSVIDGATCNGMVSSGCDQIPPTVTVGVFPEGLDVDEVTDTIFVANGGYEAASLDFTVSVINGATCNAMRTSGCGRVPHTVEVGEAAGNVAVNDKTGTVYVANFSDQALSVFGVRLTP